MPLGPSTQHPATLPWLQASPAPPALLGVMLYSFVSNSIKPVIMRTEAASTLEFDLTEPVRLWFPQQQSTGMSFNTNPRSRQAALRLQLPENIQLHLSTQSLLPREPRLTFSRVGLEGCEKQLESESGPHGWWRGWERPRPSLGIPVIESFTDEDDYIKKSTLGQDAKR